MVLLLFMTIGALGDMLSATFQAGWTWFQSSYALPVAVLVLSELAFGILWFKIFLKPGKPKSRCLDQY